MVTTFNMARKRRQEIQALVLYRHCSLLNCDDELRQKYLEMAAYHLPKPKDGDLIFALHNWARGAGAKLPDTELDTIVDRVAGKARRFKADTLGRMLQLTYAERKALKIVTIGAADAGKKARALIRKQKRRQRERDRRKLRGARPHADSFMRQQPWLAQGISRATWYRRNETVRRIRGHYSFYSLDTNLSHGRAQPVRTAVSHILGDDGYAMSGGQAPARTAICACLLSGHEIVSGGLTAASS
jgi:hypothetical protein